MRMTSVPQTSVSLLKDISDGTASARWTEFYRRYESSMRGFLHERFPSVDADDVIQEVMIALMKAMPEFHYTPDRNGHFRNYLTGIVKHKALDALNRSKSFTKLKSKVAQDSSQQQTPPDMEDEGDSWKMAAMEAAIDQMMSNESISPRTREVFRHVALMQEPPEDVARKFGITRNNVDQIKNRMIGKLSDMIGAMTA